MIFLPVRASNQTRIAGHIYFASFFPPSCVLPVKCFLPKSRTDGFGFKPCLLRGSIQEFQNYSHGVASMSHSVCTSDPLGELTMHSKNKGLFPG